MTTSSRPFTTTAAGLAISAVVFASGCGSDSKSSQADAAGVSDAGAGVDGGAVCTGDVRGSSSIYYGTAQPTYVPLTPGQVMAIGKLPGCTGTLINPAWGLTAQHCGSTIGDRFCIGSNAASPNQCFTIMAVVDHPEQDTTLAYLGVDVRDTVPEVEPIPINVVALDNSWVGQTAEAAGYGEQETGASGEREFTAEPISAIGDYLTIDGQGERGACFGDSGGPVMIIAADASVRVAGDLSWGDTDCLGKDNYARTDVIATWIESYTGPTIVGPGPFDCGPINGQGRCMGGGGVAMWCGGDQTLSVADCGAGETCGWDDSAQGYRCISGDDPCGGVDDFGACDGNIARWCEGGQPKQRDCASCANRCVLAPVSGGATCEPDPCAGLDFLGRCNGNIAEWCENGRFYSVDCSESGDTCQFVNNSIGYYCN